MKLTDYQGIQKLSILEYGESGAGKSIRAASSAGLWGPTYVFDLDNKIDSIAEFYKDSPKVRENLFYDAYFDRTIDGKVISATEQVYKKLQWLDAETTKNNGVPPYATVIFDSWTSWEEMTLEKIIRDNPGKDRKRMLTGPDASKNTVFVPTLEDYGIHSTVQSRLVSDLVSLPMNVIVIAHVQSRKDEVSGGTEIGINAVGKLWKTLPTKFTEVHRCFSDRGKHMVQVRGDVRYFCKTRLRDVPPAGTMDASLDKFTPFAYQSQIAPAEKIPPAEVAGRIPPTMAAAAPETFQKIVTGFTRK